MINAFNLDRSLATKHESLIGRAMQRQAKSEGHFKGVSGSELPTSRYSVKYALQGLINRGLIQHGFYRRNLIEYWFEVEEDL